MCKSSKTEFLEVRSFKNTGSCVTGRPDCSGPSRREVENDVWKYYYLQTIVMGLYATGTNGRFERKSRKAAL